MSSEWKTPAARRYTVRLFGFMGVYVAVMIAVSWWFRHAAPQGPVRYAAAVAPALPILGVLWALGAYMIELPDEYQRLRLARSLLWGTGLTLGVCTVWGFLQAYAETPAPPLYFVFILFMAAFGLAQGVSTLLERRA
jgi:hypothetical protein